MNAELSTIYRKLNALNHAREIGNISKQLKSLSSGKAIITILRLHVAHMGKTPYEKLKQRMVN